MLRTATTANEMARSVWPAATRARADRPHTAISTKSLPVSVSHDADLGATSFHQTKMAAPGAQGSDDDPFRHTVAGVDAPVHEGQQGAQFEEEPHRRVQRNPGRHRSLRQRITASLRTDTMAGACCRSPGRI